MNDLDLALTPFKPDRAKRVLNRLAPGCELSSLAEMPGSFSNSTWLVTGSYADGNEAQFVLRRLRGGWSDPSKRAQLEFHSLGLAAINGIPVPEPLLLDAGGDLLGAPGFVASYVEGSQTVRRKDREWVRELAATLAEIHSVRCDDDEYLLDANHEALYFTHTGGIPPVMQQDPAGQRVWEAVMANKGRLDPVTPVLVHLDFWTGNLLWRESKIVAVVDWEEASRGDPAIDVAYLRRDLWGLGLREEAAWFVEEYELITGRPLLNLPFWELAAAVRPMSNPGGGAGELSALGITDITEDDLLAAHREFIEHALSRM